MYMHNASKWTGDWRDSYGGFLSFDAITFNPDPLMAQRDPLSEIRITGLNRLDIMSRLGCMMASISVFPCKQHTQAAFSPVNATSMQHHRGGGGHVWPCEWDADWAWDQ